MAIFEKKRKKRERKKLGQKWENGPNRPKNGNFFKKKKKWKFFGNFGPKQGK